MLSVTNCTTANIGTLNPFRYRSYYYDVETDLYYLQTRYYDPETGRFINSDSLSYLGDGAELSNYNLFAYCGNNPVNIEDPEGTSWKDFWSRLKAVGEKMVEAAIVVTAIGGAVLAIAAAVTGTIASGGAGAIAIPAAIAIAAECLANAIAAVAIVGSAAVVVGTVGENVVYAKQSTPGNMNNQIKKGQAPQGVKRVDNAHNPEAGGKPHVHFTDGTAMNIDGTPHDKRNGIPNVTKKIAEWLIENGWSLFKE